RRRRRRPRAGAGARLGGSERFARGAPRATMRRMDRLRFSAIAHRRLVFCNPLGGASVDRVIDALELPRGARVLDIGCGKAELLVRLARRSAAAAVGVALSPHFLGEARSAIAARLPHGDVTLLEMDA